MSAVVLMPKAKSSPYATRAHGWSKESRLKVSQRLRLRRWAVKYWPETLALLK